MKQLLLSFTADTEEAIDESRTSVVLAVVKTIRYLTGLDLREAKKLWDKMVRGNVVTIDLLEDLSQSTIQTSISELRAFSLKVDSPLTPAEQAIEILKEQAKLLIDAGQFDVASIILEAIKKIDNCEFHGSGLIPIAHAR